MQATDRQISSDQLHSQFNSCDTVHELNQMFLQNVQDSVKSARTVCLSSNCISMFSQDHNGCRSEAAIR